jgi:hypothetical protein
MITRIITRIITGIVTDDITTIRVRLHSARF